MRIMVFRPHAKAGFLSLSADVRRYEMFIIFFRRVLFLLESQHKWGGGAEGTNFYNFKGLEN